jgi:hypothetical protein
MRRGISAPSRLVLQSSVSASSANKSVNMANSPRALASSAAGSEHPTAPAEHVFVLAQGAFRSNGIVRSIRIRSNERTLERHPILLDQMAL